MSDHIWLVKNPEGRVIGASVHGRQDALLDARNDENVYPRHERALTAYSEYNGYTLTREALAPSLSEGQRTPLPAAAPVVEAPRGEAVVWARVADDRNTVVSLYAIGDVPVNDDDLFVKQSELRPLVFGDAAPVAAVVSEAEVERAVRRGRDFGFDRDFDNPDEYWVSIEAVLTASRGGA